MYFEKAVLAEDDLIYNEPRDWLIPARHFLGNILINDGKFADAIAVYKKDLFINPNNGWALTGLAKAYQKNKNSSEYASARSRLSKAWLVKDVKIESSVF